jgi:hypothetical protein
MHTIENGGLFAGEANANDDPTRTDVFQSHITFRKRHVSSLRIIESAVQDDDHTISQYRQGVISKPHSFEKFDKIS